ncbi:hypothetical protein ES706_05585 [subsurface metagenome]|nr:hypothetical protein [Dehalococcoidia bacterium]
MSTKTTEIMEKLLNLPTYSQELGLNLNREEDRFKWFLASTLFAKRISSKTAKRTFQEFERAGVVTPENIIDAGWDKLVEILDSGGYVRYDFSTASNLLNIVNKLKERHGSLQNLYEQSLDSKDLEEKLLEFKGIGPTAVNIFLRELKDVWEKAKPSISTLAREVASNLGLRNKELVLPGIESSLVKINLEFCKGKKCSICPLQEECRSLIRS